MLTVSKLASRCRLSRSTVLYYESVGLLKPASRTDGNYRLYGDKELRILRQICLYRSVGLSIRDIGDMLGARESDATSLLKRRLGEIEHEIEERRSHQHAILQLLRNKTMFRRNRFMTKEKWVSIMKAAGFTEADMHRWHREFERSAPEEHEKFLKYLNISNEEISSIRQWSRKKVEVSPARNEG